MPCASLRGVVSRLTTWSPPSHSITESSSHSAHAARNTGHCQGLAGPGMERVGNTALLSCSLPGSRGQNQQGTTPSPCPLLACQEEALHGADGEEESHVLFWKCPLAFLSPGLCTVQWFPRDPAALAQALPPPFPKQAQGLIRSLLPLPFH